MANSCHEETPVDVIVEFIYKGNQVNNFFPDLKSFRLFQRNTLSNLQPIQFPCNPEYYNHLYTELDNLNEMLIIYANNHNNRFSGVQRDILIESWGEHNVDSYRIKWMENILILIYYKQIDNSIDELNGYGIKIYENKVDSDPVIIIIINYESLPIDVLPQNYLHN